MSSGLTEREQQILADIEHELAADRRLARVLGPAPGPVVPGWTVLMSMGAAWAALVALCAHWPVLYIPAAVAAAAATAGLMRACGPRAAQRSPRKHARRVPRRLHPRSASGTPTGPAPNA
jgi:hypothetical protein